jgi:20S proteasome alpha/beta subunit
LPQEKIIPLSEALQLAIKVLTKTADATALTPENFDIVTLTRDGGKASSPKREGPRRGTNKQQRQHTPRMVELQASSRRK